MRSGTTRCLADGTVGCGASPGPGGDEVCNAVDDDCDGEADEGFPLGEACHAGEGQCRREAVIRCDPTGGTECPAVPRPPMAEVCDEVDNDCDGTVDEGTNPCDCPGFEGVAEVCNGRDDDCDGGVDEANPGALCDGEAGFRQSCTAGACRIANCAPLTYDGNANPADGCERTCVGSVHGAIPFVYSYERHGDLREPAAVFDSDGSLHVAVADRGNLYEVTARGAEQTNEQRVAQSEDTWSAPGILFDGTGTVLSARALKAAQRSRVVGFVPSEQAEHETAQGLWRGGDSPVQVDGLVRIFVSTVVEGGVRLHQLRFGAHGHESPEMSEAVGAHQDYAADVSPVGFVARRTAGVVGARSEAQGGALLRALLVTENGAEVVGEVALPRRIVGRLVAAWSGRTVLVAGYAPPDRILVARLDVVSGAFEVTADIDAGGGVGSLAIAWLSSGPVLYFVRAPSGYSLVLDDQGRAVSPAILSRSADQITVRQVAVAPADGNGLVGAFGNVRGVALWGVETQNENYPAAIELAPLGCQ